LAEGRLVEALRLVAAQRVAVLLLLLLLLLLGCLGLRGGLQRQWGLDVEDSRLDGGRGAREPIAEGAVGGGGVCARAAVKIDGSLIARTLAAAGCRGTPTELDTEGRCLAEAGGDGVRKRAESRKSVGVGRHGQDGRGRELVPKARHAVC
jgi:hypothetical protein